MRRKAHLKAMKKIVEIRRVQQLAARIEVAKASGVLSQREARRDSDAETSRKDLIDWARAMSSPLPSLQLVAAWSAQVNASQAELRHAEADVRDGQHVKHHRTANWQETLARADAAEDLLAAASARVRAVDVENALGDLADQISYRRPSA